MILTNVSTGKLRVDVYGGAYMYALLKTQYACIYTQRMLHLYGTEGLTSNSESAGQKYSNEADVMSPNANC